MKFLYRFVSHVTSSLELFYFVFRSKILRSESSAASMSSLTLGRSPRGILGAGQPSAKLSVPQLKTEEEAVTAEDKAYVIAVGRLNSMRWPSRKDHTLRSPSPPANRPRECHVTRFCGKFNSFSWNKIIQKWEKFSKNFQKITENRHKLLKFLEYFSKLISIFFIILIELNRLKEFQNL